MEVINKNTIDKIDSAALLSRSWNAEFEILILNLLTAMSTLID